MQERFGHKVEKSLILFFRVSLSMKSKKTGLLFATTVLLAILAVGVAGIPESNAAKTQMYEVTITNLTPGQPITPPLLATHSKDVEVFTPGKMASEQLRQLAENGNSEPLVEKLKSNAGVLDIVQGTAPLVPANDPGNTGLGYSETFTVSAKDNMRYLSFASMLVCTNDGFAGIDSVKLPFYKEKTVYAKAFDARTEMNTEDFADLVPPCQDAIGVSSDEDGTGASNPEIAEDGIIIPHPGVVGDEDLQNRVHAWNGPVAKIDIVRIN